MDGRKFISSFVVLNVALGPSGTNSLPFKGSASKGPFFSWVKNVSKGHTFYVWSCCLS